MRAAGEGNGPGRAIERLGCPPDPHRGGHPPDRAPVPTRVYMLFRTTDDLPRTITPPYKKIHRNYYITITIYNT